MNRDLEDRSTPTASSERYMNTSERYMNAYERAHARAYMEQAMALADWGVRISERIGAAIERARRALRRAFIEDSREPGTATHPRGMP